MPSRKALIVGIGQYDESTSLHALDAPFGDADAVYKVLKQYGNFDLPPILLRREDNRKGWVSTEELGKALDTLFTKEDAEEVELAVFYFSGHGSYDSKSQTSYLAASDNAQAVSLRHLLDRVENSHFKNVCIWLDSCHSGGALEFKELKSKNYCVVAAASKFGYALIGKTGHSFLTELLCQALIPCKESMTTVTTFELVRYLKTQRRTLPPLQHVLFLHGERHFPLTFCDHDLPDNGQVSRDICPFKGLEAFTQNDVNFFYGRKRITQQFLDRLEKDESKRLIQIVGVSGSGKSSLVLAGILPNLLADDWEVQVIQPAGECPLHNLQVQIPTNKKYLLVIDQFEQVFTQCHDEADKTAFKHLLAMALQPDNRLYVLLTLRLDFLERFTKFAQDAHPEMGEYLRRIEFLPSLNADELHQVITEPLAQVGMSIENSLVNELSAESLDEKGSLPLLQYTLEKLWLEAKQTGNDRLTWDLYRQLGGQQGEGLRGILNQKADVFYNNLNAEQQHLLEWLMVELTQPNENQEDTRRTVPLNELHHRQPQYKDTLDALLGQLVTQERLLTQDVDNEGQATVTVAHEALIRDWQRLRAWLESNREIKSWRMRLEDSITAWKHKVSGSLLREKRLIEAQQILSKYPHSLLVGQNERAFIIASQIEAKRRKQLWMGSLVIFIVVLLVGIAATTWQWKNAKEQTTKALIEKIVSHSIHADPFLYKKEGDSIKSLLLGIQAVRLNKNENSSRNNLYNVTYSNRFLLSSFSSSLISAGIESIELFMPPSFSEQPNLSNIPYILEKSMTSNIKNHFQDVASLDNEGWVFARADFANIDIEYIYRNHISTGDSLMETTSTTHDNNISALNISQDGQKILAAYSNYIKLWNLKSKDSSDWYGFSSSKITSVRLSSNQNLAVSGNDDSTIQLWDAIYGTPIGQPWISHQGAILKLIFSPSDKWVLSLGQDKTVRKWDVSKNIRISGSGGYVDNEVLFKCDNNISDIILSPSGKILVVTDSAANIWLLDYFSGDLIKKFSLEDSKNITSIEFTPDERFLAASDDNNKIKIIDIMKEKPTEILLNENKDISNLKFNKDNMLLTSLDYKGSASVWDINKKDFIKEIHISNGIKSIAFNSNGNFLLVGSDDGLLQLYDTEQMKKIGNSWSGHNDVVTSVSFSPDDKYVVSGSRDSSLILWNAETGEKIGHPGAKHSNIIESVAFSPKNNKIISAGRDGVLWSWKLVNGELDATKLDNHKKTSIFHLAFSQDGKFLASSDGLRLPSIDNKEGYSGNKIQLWDAEKNVPIGEPFGLGYSITSLCFSRNGEIIITGDTFGSIALWSVDSRKLLAMLPSTQKDKIKYIFSNAENDTIISISDAGVQLWDIYEKQPAVFLRKDRSSSISSATVSSNGRYIVIGYDDGTLELLDMNVDIWLNKACSIANRNLSLAEWQRFIGSALPYEKTCPNFPGPGEYDWIEPNDKEWVSPLSY